MTGKPDGNSYDKPLCRSRKKQGEGTCARPAGWGTDHPGYGLCKLHGGSTQSKKTHAARLRADAEARAVLAELGSPPVTDPLAALLQLAGQVLSWQEATAELVNGLENVRYAGSNGAEQLRAEVALYERAMDRAVTVLAAISRLNIDERLVAVTERQADAVIGAVDAALAAVGVAGAEAARAKQAAARHLRSV